MNQAVILSPSTALRVNSAKDLARFGEILRSLRSLRMTDRGAT